MMPVGGRKKKKQIVGGEGGLQCAPHEKKLVYPSVKGG